MQVIIIDIAIGLLLYSICLFVLIMRDQNRQKKNRNQNDEGDDEGGLPVSLPPDFDLPPGICLPDDPRVIRVEEREEVFA